MGAARALALFPQSTLIDKRRMYDALDEVATIPELHNGTSILRRALLNPSLLNCQVPPCEQHVQPSARDIENLLLKVYCGEGGLTIYVARPKYCLMLYAPVCYKG